MTRIPLTKGKFTLVDDAVVSIVTRWKWVFNHGYALRTQQYRDASGALKCRNIYLHRFLMKAKKGVDVDHVNGDPLDNRRKNLRTCSRSENLANSKKRKDNTSGQRGVYRAREKWEVKFQFKGKTYRFGNHKSKEVAIAVAKKAMKKVFGKYSPSYAKN